MSEYISKLERENDALKDLLAEAITAMKRRGIKEPWVEKAEDIIGGKAR